VLAGFDTQRDRQLCLANPWQAQDNHIVAGSGECGGIEVAEMIWRVALV